MGLIFVPESKYLDSFSLSEASGNRTSEDAGTVMTQNGTVGSRATLLGPAGAVFDGNIANSLSITDVSTIIDASQPFGFQFLAELDSDASDQTLLSAYNGLSNGLFIIKYPTNGKFEFLVVNSSGQFVMVDSTGEYDTGATHRVCCFFKHLGGSDYGVAIQVNDDPPEIGGTVQFPLGQGTCDFYVGRRQLTGFEEPASAVVANLTLLSGNLYQSQSIALQSSSALGAQPFNIESAPLGAVIAGRTNAAGITIARDLRRISRYKPKIRWGWAGNTQDALGANLSNLETLMGGKPNMVQIYKFWPKEGEQANGGDTVSFWDEKPLANARAIGAFPIITWEPWYFDNQGVLQRVDGLKILDGDYNVWIDKWADKIRALGYPVGIRFAHEFNLRNEAASEGQNVGPQYNWFMPNGGGDASTPELYKQCWIYVRTRMHNRGATNALFYFCPNEGTTFDESWNTTTAHWPGRSHVDIDGIDGYNWVDKTDWGTFKTFQEIFADVWAEFLALPDFVPGEKPFIIGETNAYLTGDAYNSWMQDAAAVCEARKWDIILFNVPAKDWNIRNTPISQPWSMYTANGSRQRFHGE
jgi:hypothetical protein